MFIELLDDSNREIMQEIAEYRIHADLDRLLGFVLMRIEALVAHLGRCLGAIKESQINNPSNGYFHEFINEIRSISTLWANTTEEIYNLLSGEIINIEQFKQLSEISIKYLHAFGLFPKRRPSGDLWIDVRRLVFSASGR